MCVCVCGACVMERNEWRMPRGNQLLPGSFSSQASAQAGADVSGSKSSIKPDTLIDLARAATNATCLAAAPDVTLALLSPSSGVTVSPRFQKGAKAARR